MRMYRAIVVVAHVAFVVLPLTAGLIILHGAVF